MTPGGRDMISLHIVAGAYYMGVWSGWDGPD